MIIFPHVSAFQDAIEADFCIRCGKLAWRDEAVETDEGDWICRDCTGDPCPVCGKVGGDHVACTRAIEAGVD